MNVSFAERQMAAAAANTAHQMLSKEK
jgi:hypothetical protein